MKKLSVVKSVFALFCAAFLFLANSSNPPNARTGAPFPNNTNEALCGGCHAGNSQNFDGTLEINGLPATIQPNTTYPISVDITKTQGDVFRAGFQLVILDDDAENAGTTDNYGAKTTGSVSAGRTYVEHNAGARQFGSANTVTYTFDWTSPASIGGNNVTFYAVTVLGNGSGTSNDYSFTNYPTFPFAAGNPPLTITSVTGNDPLCHDDQNGSASANPSGGTGSYTYQWSNGQNTQTISNLAAGIYTVTVTSGAESVSESVSLVNPEPITVSLVNKTDIDCNNSTANASVSAFGGTDMLFYDWDNGSTLPSADNLDAGLHTVTVSDVNMCQVVFEVFIESDTQAPTAEAGANDEVNCTDTTIQLDGSGSSTGGNFSYLWQTANGNIVSGATTLSPTVNSEGTYTLTVTDNDNGCTASDIVFVTESTVAPLASAGATMELNCNNTTLTLDGTASAGGSNISYQWTATGGGNIVSGVNTATPVVNSAGVYTITVTNNNNGCQSSSEVTVTADFTAPTVSIAPPNIITCTQQNVQIDASASSSGGEFGYLWTSSSGNIVEGEATPVVTVDAAGSYTLTITNLNTGCSNSAAVTVNADADIPNAEAGLDMSLDCVTESVTLNGNGSTVGGNVTYQWNGPGITGGATTLNPTVNAAGTYTITVTNTDNGCVATDNVIVTGDFAAPNVSVAAPALLDCQQNDVTLDGSASAAGANISYLWTTAAGNLTGTNNSALTTANAAGEYCLTVTDNDNGCTSQQCITIIQASDPSVTLLSVTDPACNGDATGSVSVQATGGSGNFDFDWSNGANGNTVQGLTGGNYTVTVTDDNFCTATLTATVNEPAALTLNPTSTGVSGAGANDGTANAGAGGGTGNLTYNWSNGAMTAQITGLAPGNYQVTVTDENMCTITGEVSISNFDCVLSAVVAEVTDALCNGEATGSATVSTENTTGNVTYNWSNGNMTATADNLAAGSYTVTVNDASNCPIILTATVSEPTVLQAAVTTEDVLCNGAATGSVTVSPSGGTPPYSFSYSNGGDGNDLGAGDYSVTVTDANGCQSVSAFTITENTAIDLSFTSTPVSEDGASDGSVTVTPQGGGSGNFTFLWNDAAAQTTQTAVNLEAGEYCVTVTNGFGCTAVDCFAVAVSGCASLGAETVTTETSCNGFADGTATVTPFGGTGTYTFMWSSGGTDATETGLAAGTYSVTVTDSDNCSFITSATVMQPTALIVQLTEINNIECAGQTSGTATVTANGGTPGYTYAWSNGGTGETQTDLPAGDYTVSATDANGCQTVFNFSITEGADVTLPTVVTQNVTAELNAEGTVIIDAAAVDNGSTDNCGIASFSLSQTTFGCDDLGENTVTLFVNDINGNTAEGAALIIITDAIAPAADCPETFEVDCDGTVTYDFAASDNCSDIAITFEPGTESGSVFPEGTTEVVITAGDSSGNTAECEFTITVPELLQAAAEGLPVSCFGGNDGDIVFTAFGGMPPYTFVINGGFPGELSAGIYEVEIQDAAGCSITTEAEVTQPDEIIISVTQVIDEENNAANGAIVVEISGGTGDYDYLWTGPDGFVSVEEDIVNLIAGEYTLTVTDANGCEVVSEPITVDEMTAVTEPDWANELRIYPNPVQSVLFVKLESTVNRPLSLQIINAQGQLTQDIDNQYYTNILRVDMRNTPAGLYWIKLQIEDEIVVRKVVIK